jgi:DNA primase catalytic subunit
MTSTHLLPWYWSIFPYDVYAKWLSWDRQVVATTDPETCVFSRHIVNSAAEFEALVKSKAPRKLDLGASGLNESRRPLVIDLDITSYADVNDCVDETCARVICEACYRRIMVPAMIILDATLRQDFGLSKILWIFSGKKGVQCVCWDETVMGMGDVERGCMADTLATDPSQMFWGAKHPRNTEPGCIKRARDTLAQFAALRPVYPRLDRGVTAQTRHLLKSVFSPHPTSGYIALPILPVDAPRPLLTLDRLEHLANEGRLDDRQEPWSQALCLFRETVDQANMPPPQGASLPVTKRTSTKRKHQR